MRVLDYRRMPWPRLTHPPIREALIDVRIARQASECLPTLKALSDSLQDRFPQRRERSHWVAQFKFEPDRPTVMSSDPAAPDGYIQFSTDGDRAVQARLDGFTYSRINSYGNWNEFRDEARALWELYADALNQVVARRIAVRFINRLVLPLPCRFEDYLQTIPKVAPALPQALAEMLLRLVIPFPDKDAMVVLTQSLDAGDSPETIGVILDIDAFRPLPAVGAPSNAIWDGFEVLREVKNQVFFESLTERILESLR